MNPRFPKIIYLDFLSPPYLSFYSRVNWFVVKNPLNARLCKNSSVFCGKCLFQLVGWRAGHHHLWQGSPSPAWSASHSCFTPFIRWGSLFLCQGDKPRMILGQIQKKKAGRSCFTPFLCWVSSISLFLVIILRHPSSWIWNMSKTNSD